MPSAPGPIRKMSFALHQPRIQETPTTATPLTILSEIELNGQKLQTAKKQTHHAEKICQLTLSSQNDFAISSPRHGPIGFAVTHRFTR